MNASEIQCGEFYRCVFNEKLINVWVLSPDEKNNEWWIARNELNDKILRIKPRRLRGKAKHPYKSL